MLAAWGFLQWFFVFLLTSLVGIATLVGLYIASTLFRNTGYSRPPTRVRR